ncbi:PWWP domain-containing DNA repair factor 3B isoform X6 [Pseudorasbora parva]|uniref:PWWP domain-containing DNA repair factor 3B isoform X6 n=1 Tax=Pseudorasbora parva TaxID=51549 RepID=UPI00351EA10B
MIAGMSSAENLNAHHRRNPRRTCRISDFLSELNKPVSSFKAYILHSKETTASQDLNTAESCRQRKVKKEKEKPQIVNQNALPDASPCLQKSTYELLGINGEISSNSHKPEPLVPQKMTTPKCPSKTSKRSYKGRKNKYVQPSEKEVAASKDGLDNSVYNSCSKEHLSSSKTKGTCYQDSKKTQIHQTPSYSSTGLHTCTTLSPCCHKEMSSCHTNGDCRSRPHTPKHDQLQSSPLLSSTPSSDRNPLSPKRVENSYTPPSHQKVEESSLKKSTPSEASPSKRGRGRPRGSKEMNVQEKTSASPPWKRGRKSASSPLKSHQEEQSFETQPPSRPCIENKKPEQQKLAFMEMSSCLTDGDCSSRPRTPKRDQLQSSPLLSSTPSSDLHPLSPKRVENIYTPHSHQEVEESSLIKSTPSEASPLKRGRGRPRCCKKMNVQEQSSASPPEKRGRESTTSPVKFTQEEPSFETQPPSRPCIETKEPEPQKSDQNMSSDLSIELSVLEEPHPLNHSVFMQEEEEDQDEDEEELPSFLQQDNKKPLSISEGLCVWCKLRKYPYWPAVVKSVNHKSKKASILFIDSCLIDQKRIRKGFSVPLRNLKRFDCDEYETLVDIAKEKYGSAISWSVELISDYRIRIGCGSFSGSFIEYCAADISCPVWKKYSEKKSVLTFPSQEILGEECDNSDNNTEDIVEEQDELLSKKVLPDRSKAARNRANEHLIDFIIRRKVENRLLAVISGRESSKWMQALHKPSRPVVDVYLEDEEQVDRVYRYLNKVCDSFPETNTCLENNQVDRIRLILDVLLPEAIIHAIAGVHKLSLEKAEEKYRRGPCFSNRERQEFDMMIEQQMKLKEITQHHRP